MTNLHPSEASLVARMGFAVSGLFWFIKPRPLNKADVNHEPKTDVHTQRLGKQPVGEILTAVSEADTEGCKMKYSSVSSTFPNWKISRRIPARTKEDDAFFAKIEEAAQAAERKFGEALRSKYGSRIPSPVDQTQSSIDPKDIAVALGAKVVRS